jgi:hypothetical protein
VSFVVRCPETATIAWMTGVRVAMISTLGELLVYVKDAYGNVWYPEGSIEGASTQELTDILWYVENFQVSPPLLEKLSRWVHGETLHLTGGWDSVGEMLLHDLCVDVDPTLNLNLRGIGLIGR